MTMMKLDIRIEGLTGENYYNGAVIDLTEIAVAVDNSSTCGTLWRIWMNSGVIFNARSARALDGGSTMRFPEFAERIDRAKACAQRKPFEY